MQYCSITESAPLLDEDEEMVFNQGCGVGVSFEGDSDSEPYLFHL